MKILFPINFLIMILLGCNLNIRKDIRTSIQPPFDNIKSQFVAFTINPAQDNQIETKHGTLIRIPANAIVDEKGELVKTPVKMLCREFHSQADIMSCGIPMTYDSSGQSFDFVSAGMIEIKGKSNKKDVFIKQNIGLSIDFATRNKEEDFNLYELNETTGNWQFIKKTNPEINQRKIKKLDNFRDKFLIELDIDYNSNPDLEIFEELSWIYVDTNTDFDLKSEKWIFEEKWRDIDLKITDAKKSIYNMYLRSSSKDLNLLVSPYIEGDEATFLTALNNGILAYNNVVKKRKSEELKIQFEADLIRNFEITRFGIYNIDKINRLVESGDVYVTNADFNINGQVKTNKGKIFLFSGNEKTMLIRDDINWEKLVFKPGESNSIMVALPNNFIAICGQSEFEKVKGKSNYCFELTKLVKITSLADIEKLIASI